MAIFRPGAVRCWGEFFVIHPKKVHFAFGIKTEGWALPAELNQLVILGLSYSRR